MLINKYIYIYIYIYFRNLPAYCTKHWTTWKLNHLKLKILWLQIDLTNLDQLELEVSASYNTRWILTAKLDVIEQEVLKFLLQFVDWWCFALVSMPLSIFCQTYKKHPIYIKISTYGCDLFNYLIIKWVTYTVAMCLNRSCIQCVCDWICHVHSVYVTEYNRVIITIIITKV